MNLFDSKFSYFQNKFPSFIGNSKVEWTFYSSISKHNNISEIIGPVDPGQTLSLIKVRYGLTSCPHPTRVPIGPPLI